MGARRAVVDVGVVALSLVLIGVGAVGVFETDNGAGVAALLASGTVMLMLVALRGPHRDASVGRGGTDASAQGR